MPSPDRILTTHVGSLPRPESLIELNAPARQSTSRSTRRRSSRRSAAAVRDVVRRQTAVGIDLVNDGEFGHTMGRDYDYGSWCTYVVRPPRRASRSSSSACATCDAAAAAAGPGEIVLGRSPSAGTGTSSARPTRIPHSGLRAARRSSSATEPGRAAARSPTRARRRCARHRQPQGGARGGGHRGGLHELGRAGELRALPQRVLRDRRGAAVRLRRRDARGVQGDHRRRADPAARRPGDRRELGPDQRPSRASRPTGATR